LRASELINMTDLAEAVQYRNMDRDLIC